MGSKVDNLELHLKKLKRELNSISYYTNMIINNVMLTPEQKNHLLLIIKNWINYDANNSTEYV